MFLKPTDTLVERVAIAKTAPTVDFLYFPRQDYEGKPWSNWGDSLAINDGFNRMGVGAKVNVFPAGKSGATSRLGSRESSIGIGYGYCSGQEAVAHFGLGKYERVDVEVQLPHGKGKLTKKNVAANQRNVEQP